MTDKALDAASQEYDQAEQAYISALATGADDDTLHRLAQQVAKAAETWDVADNAAPASPAGISRYYDLPEVLSTLWRDLAGAHAQRER